jgi:hypothetical protein
MTGRRGVTGVDLACGLPLVGLGELGYPWSGWAFWATPGRAGRSGLPLVGLGVLVYLDRRRSRRRLG